MRVCLPSQTSPFLLADQPSDSVKQGIAAVAKGMTSYYTGYRPGDVPGNLPDPYYWWEAGAMFGALVDYWYYTGDDQFNKMTTQALVHQMGEDADYMPANQSKSLGNDDQGFWALSAMAAAENKYPDPDTGPGWLALAQAVFNEQAGRWNEDTCNGGLKWQIYTFNQGFDYKNTISQGCLFSLAARLARYTGNDTYADWAEKTWKWTYDVGLISNDYHFYDGTSDASNNNCTKKDHTQWTYNAGIFLYGSAVLWNVSAEAGDENNIWRERTEGILKAIRVFVSQDAPNVITEVACEKSGTCNMDQRSFKAFLARWMAATTKVAPWTTSTLDPILKASREAAAKACTEADGKTVCGLQWTTGSFDGTTGVGENMAVLEVMSTALISHVEGPLTTKTGGTSKGDPGAGGDAAGSSTPKRREPITAGDKAGAAILTILCIGGTLGGGFWLLMP
ncbi:Mannan endo-1,6-alpha-mannosidase DCW1 [Diplodia seriata]|uniref:Mannan endo-1,6-alpha-mannosidase n=1 Tax=Diplodia seriata TaxID=420778 RepID=A0A1S8BFY7_9PEZI|nr:Mannan endo-1,6-alpha-mannosidase DCW1 [Diplodia seriata]